MEENRIHFRRNRKEEESYLNGPVFIFHMTPLFISHFSNWNIQLLRSAGTVCADSCWVADGKKPKETLLVYNKWLFLIHIWISYDIIFFNIMIFYYIIIIIIIFFELYHIYPVLLIFYFQHRECFRKKYIFLYFFFKSQVFYECNIIHILVNVWPWI